MTEEKSQGYGKAIALSVFAFACFSVSDALRKYMSLTDSVTDILFWQAVSGMVLMLALSPFLGGARSLLTSHKRKWHLARGVLMALNTVSSLMAISQVPLMDAYTLFFLTPFVTTLLFMIFMGERIGMYSAMAIACGFIGGVVAFRPGFAALHPAYLYAVACLFLFSFSNMIARIAGISSSKSLVSLGFWPFFFVAGGIFVYTGGAVLHMHSGWFFFVCAVIGAAYGSALVMIAYSYALAPASEIAPYQYTQFIFALSLGYMLFGTMPDGYKLAGGLIIVVSGIVLFSRQRRKLRVEKQV